MMDRKDGQEAHAALPLNAARFAELKNAGGVLVVDFWATWCMPCKMLGPVIEQLAADYKGRAVVGKVDIDEQRELAEEYRIQSVPTVMIFRDGDVADTLIGVRPLDVLKAAGDKALE